MAAIREWYGGYSIIYRWFEDNYGYPELVRYWHYIAREIYAPLAEKFRSGGPAYIQRYFEEIIREDEGEVECTIDGGGATVEILNCPDRIWQKHYDQGFSMPRDNYYRSYEVIYGDVAQMAGYDFELLRYDPEGRLKFRFARREGAAV